jgi:hypothetical protein
MRAFLRSFLAVVTGLIAGFVVVFAVESVSHLVYPPPARLNMNDPGALREVIANMPAGAFAFVLFAQLLGTFTGALACATIAGRAPLVHAMIIGGFFFLGCILNVFLIPHPIWYSVTAPPLALAAAYLAGRAHRSLRFARDRFSTDEVFKRLPGTD